MSLVNYSLFGTTANITNRELLRGPSGFGFAVDQFGNYDIQGNNIVGIEDITIGNNIIYSAPETNNLLTSVLAVDNLDNNKIKETNLNITPFTSLNTIDLNVDSINENLDNKITIKNNLDLNNNNINNVNNINANNQLFIKNSSQISHPDCQIHIADTVASCIWLEADTNNAGETDFAYIRLTEDGNNTMHTFSGNNNTLAITSGSNAGSQGILLRNANVISAPQGTMPTFDNISTGFSLTLTGCNIFRPTNFNNNNLNNVNDIRLDTITAKTTNITMNNNINMNNNNINNINRISGNGPSIYIDTPIDMNNNNLINVATLTCLTSTITPLITSSGVNTLFGKNINLQNNNILNCSSIDTDEITSTGTSTLFSKNINMQANNILGVNQLNTSTLASITGTGENILILSDLNMTNTNINDANNISSTTITTTNIQNELNNINVLSNLNMTIDDTFLNMGGNDINNVDNMTIQSIGGLTEGGILYFENDSSAVRVEPGCQLQANDIIADYYRFRNPNNNLAIYTQTRSLSANTNTILDNWTTIQSSTFVNVNATTGIFNPTEAGIYAMTYNHTSDHTGTSAYIGVRLVRQSDNQTIYQSIQQSNNLFVAETGFESSQYESLTGYFNGIDSYYLATKMSSASTTSNFVVQIYRLF